MSEREEIMLAFVKEKISTFSKEDQLDIVDRAAKIQALMGDINGMLAFALVGALLSTAPEEPDETIGETEKLHPWECWAC